MIKIEMSDASKAKSLFHKFKQSPYMKTFEVWCEESLVMIQSDRKLEALSKIASLMVETVISEHEEQLMLEMIHSTFYYQDQDEQEQILAVAKSIMLGEKPDLPGLKQVSSRDWVLFQAYYEFLREEETLPYESFIRFRLKPYKECLLRYVEMAIDEYKLEQDYQSFVEVLRRLLKERSPLLETVKVVYSGDFELYDRFDQRINEREIREELEPIFRMKWGLEVEPSMLITLIGVAPRKVDLYTDDPDIGLIQTMQNVFQERLEILPLRRIQHFHS